MGRSLRVASGGLVYHVLNRANSRLRIFFDEGDYAAFEKVMAEAVERHGMRVLSYVLMPNHWHLVVWPRKDGDLSRFVGWLTLTHTQRWHAFRRNAGVGHLYQGRFKSFPVQDDHHLRILCRYVERNPLRAGLVDLAEEWRWSSLWRVMHGREEGEGLPPLVDGPLERGRGWGKFVNSVQTGKEEEALKASLLRGRPFGDRAWQEKMASQLGLKSTMRPRGRPRLSENEGKLDEKGS